jgi:hypothetical protein
MSNISNYGGRVADNQQGVKQFYGEGAPSVNLVYKTAQNVKVITLSDSSKPFLVNNDVYISKNLNVDGSIYNPSDERLKENIISISGEQIDHLFSIQPIEFTYKNDKLKLKHFGVLAQDMEKVFPELVNENENKYKSVNYQELIPLMLSKMKQMQNEIDELKEKINKW